MHTIRLEAKTKDISLVKHLADIAKDLTAREELQHFSIEGEAGN